MAFYVKDPATDRAVRKLAKIKGMTLTDTIREATEAALDELKREKELTFRERIKPIQDRIASYPKTGLDADKAFYDELSGDI
jgi:antitoxin VapB